MTEQQWLTSVNTEVMLQLVTRTLRFVTRDLLPGDEPSRIVITVERKLRLFAVALCRLPEVWDKLTDDRSRRAVEVAERYADGEATAEELRFVREASNPVILGRSYCVEHAANAACRVYAEPAAAGVEYFVSTAATSPPATVVAGLLRDIFGNLWRPARLDPAWTAWNDGTVRKLAQRIYKERAFDRMPLLGDALEDAGCADIDVLGHCRGPGQHVRGCWVVDLLLELDPACEAM